MTQKHSWDIIKVVGNIYPSCHEAGNIYSIEGIIPTLKCNGPRANLKKASPMIQVKEMDEKFRLHKNDPKKSGVQGGDVFKESAKTMDIIDNHPKNILVKSATASGYEEAKEGDSVNYSVPNSATTSGRVGNQQAQTIDTAAHQAVFLTGQIRRLTEIECERLQGFKDNHTMNGIYQWQVWINKKEKTFEIVEGVKKIPRTQRYKLCGNAVTVDVVEMIGKKLLNSLNL